jgi:hypothetical protein
VSAVPVALAPAIAIAVLGCGGFRTAAGPGASDRTPVDPAVVRVADAWPEGPVRRVSLAVVAQDPVEPLPPSPPEDRVDEMRDHAARQGAEVLVVEPVDLRWRKAFYGWGVVSSAEEVPVPECAHEEAVEELADVRRDAERCLAQVRARRPDVQGRVEVLFQVDAFGDVYAAAATPESSRDTELQQCVLEPVVRGSFGDHGELLCRMSLAVAPP